MCIKQTLVERVHDDRARGWGGGTISWDRDIVPLVDAHDALVAEVEHLRGERAAVVAWLRGEPERLVACSGHRHADGKPCLVLSPMPAEELADAIERGEHRREEEP